jgi:glycosyltransferase involved in cell wall biosynthesis
LDNINSRVVAKLASVVLVHGREAVYVVSDLYGISETKLRVLHHGNYAHILKPSSIETDNKSRRFLFFGLIRPYKGIPELLRNFRALQSGAQLHIAGKVSDTSLQTEIRELAARDNRVTLSLSFVSDAELKRLLAWCQVVVLPYRDVFTSGSLLMALTAGRPVVVPRTGLVTEYANEECAFFYDPNDPLALQHALQKALVCDVIPEMANSALKQSANFDWNRIGAELAKIYREIVPHKQE